MKGLKVKSLQVIKKSKLFVDKIHSKKYLKNPKPTMQTPSCVVVVGVILLEVVYWHLLSGVMIKYMCI